MAYRPEQRPVGCSVLTSGGWCDGTFHVPRASTLVDHLNLDEHEVVKLTQFRFLAKGEQHQFFALQRDAIVLVVPPDNESMKTTGYADAVVQTPVTCWFDFGVVVGHVSIKTGLRTSDFWTKKKRFVLLEMCSIHLGEGVEQRSRSVVVNTRRMIGVSDDVVGSRP